MKKGTIEAAMAILLLISVYMLSGKTAHLASSARLTEYTVVIDAGHGGGDPGKVAGDGCKEKGGKKIEEHGNCCVDDQRRG